MTTETRLNIEINQNNDLVLIQELLNDTIETLIHLGVQVHDFTATNESKEGLANQLNKLISLLKGLSIQSHSPPIQIPLDIIQYIEDGRNPDIYTREFIEVIRKVNQFLNGKSRAFSQFQSTLASQITKEFPQLEPNVNLVLETTKM